MIMLPKPDAWYFLMAAVGLSTMIKQTLSLFQSFVKKSEDLQLF